MEDRALSILKESWMFRGLPHNPGATSGVANTKVDVGVVYSLYDVE